MLDAPNILDVNGRPYTGPDQLLRESIGARLKAIVADHAQDVEALRIFLDMCLTMAVVGMRRLGQSRASIDAHVRRVFENRGEL